MIHDSDPWYSDWNYIISNPHHNPNLNPNSNPNPNYLFLDRIGYGSVLLRDHHQHQRRTKVTADKGHTNSSLQFAVVGQKSASGFAFYPLDPQKKSAVTVRILPVVQSAFYPGKMRTADWTTGKMRIRMRTKIRKLPTSARSVLTSNNG